MAVGETRAFALVTVFVAGCSTTNVTNVYQTGPEAGDAGGAGTDAGGGDATNTSDAPAEVSVDAADATGPVDAGADVPCFDLLPPPRPSADDPSDAGDQMFVVAMHTLDLGVRPDGGTPPLFGYDLDDVDTCCSSAPASCVPPVAGNHCDELGGRDNSGGQLISSLALLDPTQFNSDTINQRLQNGVYSLLLQIEGYNGEANDTQVVAGLYSSDGVQAVGDAAAPPTKWDGTDVWTIDDAFVLDGADASPISPNHYDAHAYVAGGTLVMHVDFPLSLGASTTGAMTISLSGGIVTAQVAPAAGGGFRLTSGQMAGRWNASSVLSAMQGLTLAGSSICPGTSLYTNVKQQICAAADIAADPTQDNKGAACAALAVGFGFTADPVRMGGVVASSAKTSPCGDGGADAAPDDCMMP